MFNTVSDVAAGAPRVDELQRSTPPPSGRRGDVAERLSADVVEISEGARRADAEHAAQERAERIARIREQIQSGAYETADKIEIAIQRLHRELVRTRDAV
jgi:anti-sigma28 factor (negative regulator of flagellin synthesis)